jgi:molecular chaperone Hsp33
LEDILNRTLIATAFDNKTRIYINSTTGIVEHVRKVFNMHKTSCAAFGRLLSVGLLMGQMLKYEEKVTIKITGDGPIKQMSVVADAKGRIKGDIYNPNVYMVYEDGPKKGKLNVSKAIGNGNLVVVKDLGLKNYFTSQIELVSGELGEDFAYYFTKSEQVPSACSVGVLISTKVIAAGSMIIQLLPGCDDETIAKLENKLKEIPAITTLIKDNTLEQILEIVTDNNYEILEEKKNKYYCDCSRNKFYKKVRSLDTETLKSFLDEDQIEIVCHYCQKKYYFSKDEIQNMIDSKKSK